MPVQAKNPLGSARGAEASNYSSTAIYLPLLKLEQLDVVDSSAEQVREAVALKVAPTEVLLRLRVRVKGVAAPALGVILHPEVRGSGTQPGADLLAEYRKGAQKNKGRVRCLGREGQKSNKKIKISRGGDGTNSGKGLRRQKECEYKQHAPTAACSYNISVHDTMRFCSHRRTWVHPPGPCQTGSWLRPAGLPSSPEPRKPAQTEAHVDRMKHESIIPSCVDGEIRISHNPA